MRSAGFVMQENDLIQDFIYQGGAIDSLWTMFLSVHFALIAGVFFAKDKLPVSGKWFLCIGYAGFVIINSRAMYISYDLLDAFRDDINNIDIANHTTTHLSKFFSLNDYNDRLYTILLTHLFAALLVIWQIYTQGMKPKVPIPKRKPRHSP